MRTINQSLPQTDIYHSLSQFLCLFSERFFTVGVLDQEITKGEEDEKSSKGSQFESRGGKDEQYLAVLMLKKRTYWSLSLNKVNPSKLTLQL